MKNWPNCFKFQSISIPAKDKDDRKKFQCLNVCWMYLLLLFFRLVFASLVRKSKSYSRAKAILGDPGVDSGGEGNSKQAGKYGRKEKWRTARRAPGDNVLPDQFQTVAAVLASDWCQKNSSLYFSFVPHFSACLDFPSPPPSAPGSPRMRESWTKVKLENGWRGGGQGLMHLLHLTPWDFGNSVRRWTEQSAFLIGRQSVNLSADFRFRVDTKEYRQLYCG